jgi:hypothetical protein
MEAQPLEFGSSNQDTEIKPLTLNWDAVTLPTRPNDSSGSGNLNFLILRDFVLIASNFIVPATPRNSISYQPSESIITKSLTQNDLKTTALLNSARTAIEMETFTDTRNFLQSPSDSTASSKFVRSDVCLYSPIHRRSARHSS